MSRMSNCQLHMQAHVVCKNPNPEQHVLVTLSRDAELSLKEYLHRDGELAIGGETETEDYTDSDSQARPDKSCAKQ